MAFEKCTLQTAVASLVVILLSEMETMCAKPEGERCVSLGSEAVEVVEAMGAEAFDGEEGLDEDE